MAAAFWECGARGPRLRVFEGGKVEGGEAGGGRWRRAGSAGEAVVEWGRPGTAAIEVGGTSGLALNVKAGEAVGEGDGEEEGR